MRYAVIAGLLVTTISNITLANARTNPTGYDISYYLPQTRVAATADLRITKCEGYGLLGSQNGKKIYGFSFDTASQTSINASARPDYDRLVTINGDSGFLVDRATNVTLYPNGTLNTINASATGQGGPVLSAIIQTGAQIVALTSGVPPVSPIAKVVSGVTGGVSQPTKVYVSKYVLKCTDFVKKGLQDLKTASDNRSQLVAKVQGGDTSAATQALIALRDQEIAKLRESLTLKVPIAHTPKYGDKSWDYEIMAKNSMGNILPKFEKWFTLSQESISLSDLTDYNNAAGDEDDLIHHLKKAIAVFNKNSASANKKIMLPGLYGYKLKYSTPSAAREDLTYLSADGKAVNKEVKVEGDNAFKHTNQDNEDNRDLIYVIPIPASAKYFPCADDRCSKEMKAANASATVQTKLPQLSKIRRLKTGGSIFGTRTITAMFSPLGEPLALSTSKGDSGTGIASVLNATQAAITTIDGAELQAIQDRIARLNAEQQLRDLQDMPEDTNTE